MQQLPTGLTVALRTAFQASRPVHRFPQARINLLPAQRWRPSQLRLSAQARDYANGAGERSKTLDEAERKLGRLEDEQAQLAQALGEHAAAKFQSKTAATEPKSRTLVPPWLAAVSEGNTTSTSDLPSQTSSRQSNLSKRFSHIMDNFQSNIFTASQRINDLTGYTGIEKLRMNIEEQEHRVVETRHLVKELRQQYAEAVATRSTTQREVNDLLHRKHNWTPTDLERFTSLYRSDHASEQAEQAAQTALSEAEAKYEEASTKLGRTILARYHEEQIWSDKIRQMSTWGTWGLMGLNVLLFIVFQIAIEPWRRRRLVKGFEEKVEEALAATDPQRRLIAVSSTRDATAALPEAQAKDVADALAGTIVDAVSGSTDEHTARALQMNPSPQQIEDAIESVTDQELSPSQPSSSLPFSPSSTGSSTLKTSTQTSKDDPAFPQPSTLPLSTSVSTESSNPLDTLRANIKDLFSDEHRMSVTQRELTAVALEGAVAGAAVVGLVLVLLRPR